MKLEEIGHGARKLNPLIFKAATMARRMGGAYERDLHDQIFDECRAHGWIAFHGSMAERTHRTEGEPDFTILADRGRTFFIECKSKTGKLSAAQTAIRSHAAKLGHTVHLVRTLEEFRNIVAG